MSMASPCLCCLRVSIHCYRPSGLAVWKNHRCETEQSKTNQKYRTNCDLCLSPTTSNLDCMGSPQKKLVLSYGAAPVSGLKLKVAEGEDVVGAGGAAGPDAAPSHQGGQRISNHVHELQWYPYFVTILSLMVAALLASPCAPP